MVYSGPPSRNEALGMIDTTVDVINKLGLHARASGKLIEVTTNSVLQSKLEKETNWWMPKYYVPPDARRRKGHHFTLGA